MADPRSLFGAGLSAPPTVERPAPAPRTAERFGLPSSVIHELRTPLTSIHGYAQVLKRTLRNEPKASNAVAVLNRESARLSDMLGLLSELSDLEDDEPAPEHERIQLADLVDGVVHDITRREGEDRGFIVFGDAQVLASRTLVAQALAHVLVNAVRYSGPGQNVTVEVRSAGGAGEILVHDDGIGIPPADQARVFAPFERGSNARDHGVRGLGLGLYLARRALEQTGGDIEIVPVPGRASGTTVRITVPAA
ncbi:MAG: HAMP domain-containing histidine kinase [Chloroflexi bacterium]|nr:HAMP domain-containing histidine kinase [Chloroflexota bacterium]